MAALDLQRKVVISGEIVCDGWVMVVDVSVVMCDEATMRRLYTCGSSTPTSFFLTKLLLC
jgi:hypothetical protein